MVAGSARVGKGSGLVPVPFLSYRPAMTPREQILFTIRMALRKVPDGIWRGMVRKDRRRAGGDPDAEIAARIILEQIELANLDIRQRPPLPPHWGLPPWEERPR
jgi:hypothetical protein